MKRLIALLLTGAALVGVAPTATASDVTYTFESPEFTAGEFTPISPRSPNIGNPAFTATFVSETLNGMPDPAGFQIKTPGGIDVFNTLFSGQALIGVLADHSLVITFNMDVSALSFNYATTEPLGEFRVDAYADAALTMPVGTASFTPTDLGDGFSPGGTVSIPTGTMSFPNGTQFRAIVLRSFAPGTEDILPFSIDEMQATVPGLADAGVPEPATLAVFGTLALGAFGFRRRQKSPVTA